MADTTDALRDVIDFVKRNLATITLTTFSIFWSIVLYLVFSTL